MSVRQFEEERQQREQKLIDENKKLRRIVNELGEVGLKLIGDSKKQIASHNEDLALLEKMHKQLDEKDVEIKCLREALGFYANEENWEQSVEMPFEKGDYCSEVDLDKGKIARKALEGEQHGPSTD